MMRVGVDTGGTFTDFVFWDGERRWTHKVRSTPDDPSRAILAGLDAMPEEVVHGSTVATNALLERRGARTAFVTTSGFEDLLEIGRQDRAELYNWFAPAREALVERDLRFGLHERTLFDGSVLTPLALDEVAELADLLVATQVESAAVCLLHAYANPEHEKAVGEALRARGLSVSLSHEALPEYREYERAATTAVNAYISPLMARYLSRLSAQFGADTRLRVFGSNGGSMTPALAGDRGVNTVMSGPAGGVLGAVAVARAAGFERIVTFDMGGTSTDVSLYDGRLSFTSESEVGGLPIRVSMLDIHSVGAGGGSIAYFDRAGALKVGPRSAGATPGPVCYGVGEEIAVTDANLLLGRIDPKRFLSGRMELDVDRARDRMGRMADQAGVSVEKLAKSIIEVANSNMERAIRKISVERGRDPREFTLLSFGGAGGLHACELAARLEMKTVVIPKDAGVLSALGMLTAEFVRDFSASVLDCNVEAALADLEARAATELADEGFAEIRLERSLDLRYAGQSFEITLPYAERERFDDAHERLYDYSHAGRAVEAVTARVRAIGVSDDDSALDLAAPSDDQDFSSVYVPARWKERADSAGNQIVTLET